MADVGRGNEHERVTAHYSTHAPRFRARRGTWGFAVLRCGLFFVRCCGE